MATCRECGIATWRGRKLCHTCLMKWENNRRKAYAQVVEELGNLSPENHKEFTKRLRQIEKNMKTAQP